MVVGSCSHLWDKELIKSHVTLVVKPCPGLAWVNLGAAGALSSDPRAGMHPAVALTKSRRCIIIRPHVHFNP